MATQAIREHNIDSAGVDRRLRMGIVTMGLSLLLLVALSVLRVHWAFSFFAVPPLYGSFLLTYQAGMRVCSFKARHGKRDVGYGEEKVADRREIAALRRRGRTIQFLSVASAAVVAVGFVLAARF